MQVERLRKRLIKEPRERGELEKEGERNLKPRWVQESEALRFQQGARYTWRVQTVVGVLGSAKKGKKRNKRTLSNKSPTSIQKLLFFFFLVLFKCRRPNEGKRIRVSPSFPVLPSSLDQIVLSSLAGRLETLKMFSLGVAVRRYSSHYARLKQVIVSCYFIWGGEY